MRARRGPIAVAVVVFAALLFGTAATANAMYVSGQQKLVNERAGKFKMKGDLLGKWKITKFKQTHNAPVFKGKGTEKFNGCIDLNGDRACDGDPSGVMKFRFRYWGSFNDDGSINLGACAHPVVGGKGSFAGASGFLMMVDRPKKGKPFVKTHYEGEIDLAGSGARAGDPPRGC